MLTTPDKARRMMGDPPEEDLIPVLLAASTAIEDRCRRKFGYASYTEWPGSLPGSLLALKNYPVYTAEANDLENSPLHGIEILDNGILFRRCGWPQRERSITVHYTGGYILPGDNQEDFPAAVQKLPETLEYACIMLAKYLLREPGVQQERVGDISVTYSTDGIAFPAVVESLIAPHVRILS
jgi:hypothetical protein